MRFIPSDTTRRRTSRARAGSSGSPHASGPGRRIAPKPSRTTSRSPRRIVDGPWAKAGEVEVVLLISCSSFEADNEGSAPLAEMLMQERERSPPGLLRAGLVVRRLVAFAHE